jgi:hypothetical protein
LSEGNLPGVSESSQSKLLFVLTLLWSFVDRASSEKQRCAQSSGTKNLKHNISDHIDFSEAQGVRTKPPTKQSGIPQTGNSKK